MTTAAEMLPMASPDFEKGPPSQKSIELARVVDRGIRETETIDFDKLCIEPGEKVWMVFIDSHILDYDGNLIDACSLGAMAALMTAKVPNMKKGLNIPDVPLPINHWPITCTAMKIGDKIAFDPSLTEDQVGRPRLSVSIDENGDIRAMQKGEEGGFTKEEVKSIIAMSRVKGNDIRRMLQDHVKSR
jgi:exosome complex component RRP42